MPFESSLEPAPDMAESDVLDPRQLVRITALHGGFLYQHLYAAACMLGMGSTGVSAVVVERDEDIELIRPGGRIYIQVKTRSARLSRDDVADTLARFGELRKAHAERQREGTPRFLIVSNIEPAPSLASDIKGWPEDVELAWPGRDSGLPVPPASTDLPAAIELAKQAAEGAPFAGLPAADLVWKLAAVAQYAAAGGRDRRIEARDMPELMARFIVQLQTFPPPPEPYRPRSGEPTIEGGERVRLLTGLSGAGKTAWAAHAARHSAAPLVYFDVSDLPRAAVPNALARELAARFLGHDEAAAAVAALPGQIGLELFRHLARLLDQLDLVPTVVLDNAHGLDAQDVRAIIEAAPALRFVLVGQPWPGADELALTTRLVREELGGWSPDTIAAEFQAAGARVDPQTAVRLTRLTSSLPLLVQGAAELTVEHYGGDAAAFCAEVEAADHAAETPAEIILRRVFDDLAKPEAQVASALSLLDAPLTRTEVADWLSPFVGEGRAVAQALRTLVRKGLVQLVRSETVRLHDAFRVLGVGRLAQSPAEESKLLVALRDLLQASIAAHPSFARFTSWIRLLAKTGEVETLVDLATFEMFHERGDPDEFYAVLEGLAASSEDPELRLWTLDALAFWDQRHERWPRFKERVVAIETILGAETLSTTAVLAGTMKVMAARGDDGDMKAVRAAYDKASRLPGLDEEKILMVNYNLAFCQLKARRPGDAMKTVHGVILGYYRRLGLTELQIVGRRAEDILAMVKPYSSMHDDFRHLGDALDLECHALQKLGRLQPLHRLLALKFYQLGMAYRSFLKTGLELVDDFRQIGEFQSAREILETGLLPNLGAVNNMMVSVRRIYALVLSETGEPAAGLREMSAIAAYDMPEDERALFEAQLQMMRALQA